MHTRILRARALATATAVAAAMLTFVACNDNDRSPQPSGPSPVGANGITVRAMPASSGFRASPGPKLSPSLSVGSLRPDAAHPSFRIAVVGGDTTNEYCRSWEFCAIQGQAAEGYVAVLCTNGPGTCESGNYEWSIEDAPPKSSTTFTPDTTVTEQFARVAIQTTDSTPPEMYTVSFVPTPLPGSPIPDPLTVQGVVHVLCSFNHHTCPKLEIVDRGKSDSVVSLPDGNPTVRTTLIGKHMDLQVRLADSTNYSMVAEAWTLFLGDLTDVVKTYDITLGQVEALEAGDLSNSTLSYYYVVARSGYPIAVEAELTGKTNPDRVFLPEAGARYNLNGPTAVLMSAPTTTVVVGSFSGDTSSTSLSFGTRLVSSPVKQTVETGTPGCWLASAET